MAPTFSEWAAPDLSLIGKANPFGAFEHLGFVAATLLAFVILLSIFFDAMGTMVGLANEAGTVDKDGNIPDVDRVLQVDALDAISGASSGGAERQWLSWDMEAPLRTEANSAGNVIVQHQPSASTCKHCAGPMDAV